MNRRGQIGALGAMLLLGASGLLPPPALAKATFVGAARARPLTEKKARRAKRKQRRQR